MDKLIIFANESLSISYNEASFKRVRISFGIWSILNTNSKTFQTMGLD